MVSENYDQKLHELLTKENVITQTPSEFQLSQGVANLGSMELAKQKLNECYDEIIDILKEYLDMPEDYYKFITTWIIGTYFHDEFNTYPYLFFNAMRGSGKTRTLKLISTLGAKGDGSVQTNLTEAVLFRIKKGTTTCIDEVEQIGSKEKATIRELLNAGYKKGNKIKRMKKVFKKGGEEQTVDVFEPYFPIALANIWGVEEVLADRSIVLVLEKSNNPKFTKKIEDFDTNPRIIQIKRTLTAVSVVCAVSMSQKTYKEHWNRYVNERYNDIYTYTTTTTLNGNNNMTDNELKEKIEREDFFLKVDGSEIEGRNFELLFPILITAKAISEEIFNEILVIAKSLVGDKKEEEYAESRDVSFYDFIASHGKDEYVPIKDLAHHFKLFAGDTEYNKDENWVNEHWVGQALKRLRLIKSKRRMAAGRLVIVDVEKAKEKIKIFKKESQ